MPSLPSLVGEKETDDLSLVSSISVDETPLECLRILLVTDTDDLTLRILRLTVPIPSTRDSKVFLILEMSSHLPVETMDKVPILVSTVLTLVCPDPDVTSYPSVPLKFPLCGAQLRSPVPVLPSPWSETCDLTPLVIILMGTFS